MILPDVNVLLYAFRKDAPDHAAFHRWLQDTVNRSEAYALSSLVLSGFLRIATHPRVFTPPADLASALAFVDALRSRPNCVLLDPGARHWDIFVRLAQEAGAKGNLLADAYFVALAVEHGCEWITTDRDYARFKSLKWRHPLA